MNTEKLGKYIPESQFKTRVAKKTYNFSNKLHFCHACRLFLEVVKWAWGKKIVNTQGKHFHETSNPIQGSRAKDNMNMKKTRGKK